MNFSTLPWGITGSSERGFRRLKILAQNGLKLRQNEFLIIIKLGGGGVLAYFQSSAIPRKSFFCQSYVQLKTFCPLVAQLHMVLSKFPGGFYFIS